MSKKTEKLSSFFIGFCLITCILWHPPIYANDSITARIRQAEGTPPNGLSSEETNKNAQPKSEPNTVPQKPAVSAETISQTPPDNLNSPEKSPDPVKENVEDLSKKADGGNSLPQNIQPPKNAVGGPNLGNDPRKDPKSKQPIEPGDTADSLPQGSSKKQIPQAVNLEDVSTPFKKGVEPIAPSGDEDVERGGDIVDKGEANSGSEKAEDFPSYTEWTKKVLAEEKNKQEDQGKASSSLPQKQKMRNNYASADCGAKIVLANPEAENTKFILNGNPDEYMINPCQAKKWFIVELCETIQIKNIETASLELFSSRPKSFRFSVSDRYPSKEWQELGTFDSTEERTIHKYQIADDNYSKFIKVDILNHYGGEHFCPLTLFRVFGFTIEEDIDGEPSSSHSADDEDDDVQNESPPNLFNSAKDTVLRLVKHVLTTGNEKEGKEGAPADKTALKENPENTTVVAKESDKAVTPPNVTIPCNGSDSKNLTQKNATTNGTSLPEVPDAKDQRSIDSSTPTTTLPIQPEEPQGNINLMTNATMEYPDENLVTKLEDYEQVPVSPEEEPIVQLIGFDEQLPLFTVHTTACMYCSLRKKKPRLKTPSSNDLIRAPRCLVRPSHTTKCKFLRIISDIFFRKQQGVSDSTPKRNTPGSSVVTIIQASSAVASSSSSSKVDVSRTVVAQVLSTVESESTLSTHSKSISDSVRQNVPQLEPSSDVSYIASSETVSNGEKSLQPPKKGGMESVTGEAKQYQEVNLTSELENKMASSSSSLVTTPLQPSSAGSGSGSSGISSSSTHEDVDFRTPAGTIYIEPSSTSMTELPLQQGVSSSERPTLNTLSPNPTPTSSVLPDGQAKPDTAPSSDSDPKDKDSAPLPESNIITTASLPTADGDVMEPPATNIEPTRVSESPSKAVPSQSVTASIPEVKDDSKVAQAVEGDPEADSKGRPLYTLVRVGLPPAVKRESAIMRLNNRIKALELNVSLSSRFLDELSQRYRKQSEEMMNFLNRTVARLRNATKKTEETVQRHEVHLNVLEARLDNLTQAVSKLSDSMDELTRHKRQPSLPPSLVAKVLEDLLHTQNSSHNRRRNSDSEILQLTPNHREVVRQRSADDLACPKTVDIMEPEIPFLLGQLKDGHKKKKRKKNKSMDLKLNGTSKSVLPAHRAVSSTELNSAGLLFLGLPEEPALTLASDPSAGTLPKKPERTKKKPQEKSNPLSDEGSCSIVSSKSDPDLYSPYQPVVPPPPLLLPSSLAPKDPSLDFKQSVITTDPSDPCFITLTSRTPASGVLPLPYKSGTFHPTGSTKTGPVHPQAKSSSHFRGPHHQAPFSSASSGRGSLHGHNPHHAQLRHSASLPESKTLNNPEVIGALGRPVTISATGSGPSTTGGTSSSTMRNRYKTLNVTTQKNFPDRKGLGRCSNNQVQCSTFRKY